MDFNIMMISTVINKSIRRGRIKERIKNYTRTFILLEFHRNERIENLLSENVHTNDKRAHVLWTLWRWRERRISDDYTRILYIIVLSVVCRRTTAHVRSADS